MPHALLPGPILALLCVLCVCLQRSSAQRLQNVTVDDQSSAIHYEPEDAWVARNCAEDCHRSVKNFDFTRVHSGTWTQGLSSTTGSRGVTKLTFEFTGVAVYVYAILADTTLPIIGRTNLNIFLDERPVVNVHLLPSGTRDLVYKYDQELFSQKSLEDKNHTLTINVLPDGHNRSVMFLDSITYSTSIHDEPTTANASLTPNPLAGASMSSPAPTAKIVGGVLGAIAALILIALGILMYRRRQTSRKALIPVSSLHSHSSAPPSQRLSRTHTFNPSLLVRARHIVNKSSLSLHRTRRPPAPLQNDLIRAPLDIPSPMHSARDRLVSIESWRIQTERELEMGGRNIRESAVPPDMSEELSSYYETTTGQTDIVRVGTPPPLPPAPGGPPPVPLNAARHTVASIHPQSRPRPLRRFTVMNN